MMRWMCVTLVAVAFLGCGGGGGGDGGGTPAPNPGNGASNPTASCGCNGPCRCLVHAMQISEIFNIFSSCQTPIKSCRARQKANFFTSDQWRC